MNSPPSTIPRSTVRWRRYWPLFAVLIVIAVLWNWHEFTLWTILAKTDSMIVSVRRYRETVPKGEPQFRHYKLTPEQSKAYRQFLRVRTFGASDRLYARYPLFDVKTLDDKGEQRGRMLIYVTRHANREVLQAMEALAENGEALTDEAFSRTTKPNSPVLYRYVNR